REGRRRKVDLRPPTSAFYLLPSSPPLCIPCNLWSKLRSSNRARRSVPLPVGSLPYPDRICAICGKTGSIVRCSIQLNTDCTERIEFKSQAFFATDCTDEYRSETEDGRQRS